MLTHLTIENLALVERIDLEIGPGLTVLTGETGAGKSVLVSALSLVLGARAAADAIRTGENEGSVEAYFELEPGSLLERRLQEKGIDVRDGALLVRRVVSRNGRTRVLLNGQMATVGMLADVLRGVLDVTSQHEHVSLLDPDMHLDIVDAFGELTGLARQVGEIHAQVVGYETALAGLDTDESEKARREDYLRFALKEIEEVSPQPAELDSLESDRKRLKSVTELVEGAGRAEAGLYSDEGAVVEVVGKIERDLSRLSGIDDRLAAPAAQAKSVLAELEDLARSLERYLGSLEADPVRLESIEDRIELLKKLVRKHGGSIESALAAREQMAAELDDLDHEEARRADLSAALEAERERLAKEADRLSAARKKVVSALESGIQRALADLSMEKTKLAIELRALPQPGPRGQETAEITISPNPGEPMRPLRKIASGGELSRILLAVKHVLANKAQVSSYVFDEIDTGIGGAVADVLGKKLKEVARSTQVLCVTHLPQVAAHADLHLLVSKLERSGRTVTQVAPLDDAARVEELARMLGGATITDRTRSLAEEMRGLAQSKVSGASASSRPSKAASKRTRA